MRVELEGARGGEEEGRSFLKYSWATREQHQPSPATSTSTSRFSFFFLLSPFLFHISIPIPILGPRRGSLTTLRLASPITRGPRFRRATDIRCLEDPFTHTHPPTHSGPSTNRHFHYWPPHGVDGSLRFRWCLASLSLPVLSDLSDTPTTYHYHYH